MEKTKKRMTGFGFVNKYTGSSIFTVFKELLSTKNDEELSKEDNEFLNDIVLKEDSILRSKLAKRGMKKSYTENNQVNVQNMNLQVDRKPFKKEEIKNDLFQDKTRS